MLREFVEKKHYKFAEAASDWREAIRMSCESIEADGTVETNYKEEIVRCVETYGPYIVLIPNVAMPHSSEGAVGVNKTAIAFMHLEKPVAFEKDEEGEIKEAQLFFTVASCDPQQHIDNIQKLAELFNNDEVIEALADAHTPEDLIAIQEKFLD
ncbi:MAG: PTS sugar transporter subunit IIA [Lachnospiraceae bacterium]|nr:PTS sugar transporter subunit IIA [Lachnospiraceae bacterium]